MAYIGNTPAENYASFLTETFTVSATTNYTLSHAVANENDIRLVINGVVQQPGSGKAYTASGTTLTLTSATVSGDVMYAVYLGRALQTVNPPAASVGNSQTAPTIITGQTAETSIATDDTILIHDTSASALRKMTRANFVSGIGGTNTPAFLAYKTSNQSISNTTNTKITFEAEQLDSGSVYDTSNSRFTPGVAGYYWIGARWRYDTGDDFDTAQYRIYKNGSIIAKSTFINQNSNGGFLNMIVLSDADDYFEMYGYQNKGSSTTINGDSTYPEQDQAQFYAFKIIE